MIIRAKNKDLFQHSGLTNIQLENQAKNEEESGNGETTLISYPSRI